MYNHANFQLGANRTALQDLLGDLTLRKTAELHVAALAFGDEIAV